MPLAGGGMPGEAACRRGDTMHARPRGRLLQLIVLGVAGSFGVSVHGAAPGAQWGPAARLRSTRAPPSQWTLRPPGLELRGLRGGGHVASPGKRALDSELEVSDVADAAAEPSESRAPAAAACSRRRHLAKRMTVRGGNAEGAPAGDVGAAAEGDEAEIDEALYNRQLYVFGHDAMKKMQKSNILLIGVAGLGVEVAKNLALAGVKSLTLHDPRNVRVDDLSAQYYCGEEHVGKNRAEVSLERVVGLNRNVEIKILEGPVNKTTIEQYSLVICTDSPFGECVMVNDACRAAGVKFIMTQARGLAGDIFVDLGDDFEVTDTNGENPAQAMVSLVSNDKKAQVTTLDEQRHGLEDGDYVTFTEVEGMTELNALAAPVKVKVLGPYTLQLDLDTSKYGAYTGGGYVRQVKQPSTVHFATLRQSLREPLFLTSDFAKIERERQLLLAFQAVDSFFVQLGAYPRPGVVEDADKVVMMAHQFNTEYKTKNGELLNAQLVEEVDEALIRTVAMQSRGQLAPVMSVLGSIAAQEALKAISGKFMPVRQFFMFDALECLPGPDAEGNPLPPEEFEGECQRYDGQIACLGKGVQRRLEQLNYFLVGAGAIGCEMLKNWAMMGVGAGEGGNIHCTDMDVIEKSNLNRQFLFRPEDVGSLKSDTAGKRAKDMNPYLNVQTYSTKMGPDTEDIFDDDWFEALDGVCNALDNVQARTYMDQRCVYLGKSLLESGTLGTKGNVQVVIPHITESYSSSRDPPEKAIPVCTLKNFPNAIEHTIQWARDDFEGVFKQHLEDANSYLSHADKFFDSLEQQPTMAAGTVSNIKNLLGAERPTGFRDCIQWARQRFQDLFHNQIHQLLFNFPRDMTDSQGQPFWAGAKRPPKPLDFDEKDVMHTDFVIAAATLRAQNFGLAVPATVTAEDVRQVVSKMKIAPFTPKAGVKIAAAEGEAEQGEGGGGGWVDGGSMAVAVTGSARSEVVYRLRPST